MWFFYLLLTVGSSQGQSNIRLSGGGKIVDGKASLDIHVEIANPGAAGVVPTQGPPQLPTGTGAQPIRPTMNTRTPPNRPTMNTGKTPIWPAKNIGKPPTGPTKSTGPPQSRPTTGQGAGTGAFTQEERAGLAKHNEFRQIHEAPPMKLNREMCDQAKAYAKRLAAMGTLQHSDSSERRGQGENLSMGCSTSGPQSMEEAVKNWYNEVCDPGYNFGSGGFSSGTGHFTQVVWKESTELGIGRAESQQNGMQCAYIVGRYKPAGNMMGDFPQNVKKGSFSRSQCQSNSNSPWQWKKFVDRNEKGPFHKNRVTKVDVPEYHFNVQPAHKIQLLQKKTF